MDTHKEPYTRMVYPSYSFVLKEELTFGSLKTPPSKEKQDSRGYSTNLTSLDSLPTAPSW